jgi:hypothetical protein
MNDSRKDLMIAKIVVQPDIDVDAEELDQLTHELRERLLDEAVVDSADVEISADPVPERAKSQYASIADTLVLALSPVTLHSLIQLAQSWLKNRPVRTIKITIGGDSIEISNPDKDDQRKLIESFTAKHGDK